ncbi:MAG TPA: endolytic transglycosylase MltG [Nevskiaceae bacterium]|nr:endolytic transglycosylase MltG [Nevskiaceae bacterium]
MRRFLAGILLVPLLLAAAALLAWRDAQGTLAAPLPITEKFIYEIPVGAPLQQVIADLRQRGVVLDRRLGLYLRIYAEVKKLNLRAGEYELTPGISAIELLTTFASGKTLLHELRIVEGWTFAQAMKVIAADPDLAHSLEGKSPEQVMAQLGYTDTFAEGRLFPDTYRFPKGLSDITFLRRAAATMDAMLQKEWDGRDADLPYASPADALIMASIVEKETGQASERPEVAGVFVNRLRSGMKLQTDPTIIYGLGPAFDGNLRKIDLETDGPYNTYTRAGLPPTPICLPGRASLHAVLHPAQTKALYFVSRGDGTHVFSETYDAHSAAVQKFQIAPHAAHGKK